MAATNKSLAQTNKSHTRGKATDNQRSDTGSAAQLRAPPTARPFTGQRCRSSHLWRDTLAATNKSLARNNKSRTGLNATKKRRSLTGSAVLRVVGARALQMEYIR
jgi:hypothetical protein